MLTGLEKWRTLRAFISHMFFSAYGFICSLTYLFAHSLIHSFIYSFNQSMTEVNFNEYRQNIIAFVAYSLAFHSVIHLLLNLLFITYLFIGIRSNRTPLPRVPQGKYVEKNFRMITPTKTWKVEEYFFPLKEWNFARLSFWKKIIFSSVQQYLNNLGCTGVIRSSCLSLINTWKWIECWNRRAHLLNLLSAAAD